MRKTLGAPVAFDGVGLHGGRPVRMVIAPAPAGTGVVFERRDVAPGTGRIPAAWDLVADTLLCTRLENVHGVALGTVEHVMAALAGLGVTDALIRVDGPEVPIMDGSAAVFASAIRRVGLRSLRGPLQAIRLRRSVTVTEGDKRATLHPAPVFGISFAIDFEEAAIGRQSLSMRLTRGAFETELADCRTFGRLAEVEQMRRLGLGLGGSLDNAIVVDGERVLNPGGLRRADEFVRHKMLDALGDLALAGCPILGHYEGVRAGHGLTNRLLRALFDDPDAWDRVEPAPWQIPSAGALTPEAEPARVAV